MGQKESALIKEDFRDLPENERMFRFNAGHGWAGEILKLKPGASFIYRPGYMVLKNARPFNGAPKGFPDTAGWKTVEVTPDMVGQKLAVFVGREYKTKGVKLSKAQKVFKKVILAMGGIFEERRG